MLESLATKTGPLAHPVERIHGMDEASGSSPLGSTTQGFLTRYILNSRFVQLLAAALTAVVSLVVQVSNQAFNTVDAYYHSTQSIAYYTGTEIPYPYFTNFSLYPADIWIGYHYVLGLFHTLIPGTTYQQILLESFVFHALLGAATIWLWLYVFGIWYMTTTPLLRATLARSGVANVDRFSAPPTYLLQLSIFSVLIVFFADTFFRLALTQRPHIVMVMIILGCVLALIQRRYVLLFFLCMAAPFVYSVSWFVFIPIAGICLGWIQSGFTKDSWRVELSALLASITGFLIGVILHPHTVGYIVNGLGFGTFAIFQSVLGPFLPGLQDLYIANEMQFSPHGPGVGVLLLILVAGYALYHLPRASNIIPIHQQSLAILQGGMFAISGFLLISSVFVYRVIEYSVPLGLLVFTPYLVVVGTPFINQLHQQVRSSTIWYSTLLSSISKLPHRKTIFSLYGLTIVLALLVTQYSPYLQPFFLEFNRYQGAAEFLSQLQSKPGAVVAPTVHDMYGQLVFFGDFGCQNNQCEKYIASGMDNRLMYLFDPTITTNYETLIGYNSECWWGACGFASARETEEFMSQLNIVYIVHDTKDTNPYKNALFANGDYLEIIYTDVVYPTIHIYQHRSNITQTNKRIWYESPD